MTLTPDTPVILPGSPDTAAQKTVNGWVSRHGRFFGANEAAARYDGCTHVACHDCGRPTRKGSRTCSACRDQHDLAHYQARPRQAWDGTTPLYSEALERYYATLDEAIADQEEGVPLADLRLVLCRPNHARLLDDDYFADDLAPDAPLPPALAAAVRAFNDTVRTLPPLSWSPGPFALALSDTDVFPG